MTPYRLDAAAAPDPKAYYRTLAFLGGFYVMLLEMCAFRVLCTAFGSSIYVTGSLLALIMIALSIGYYSGGWLSHRASTVSLLLVSLATAVLYVDVVQVFLSDRILEWAFGMVRRDRWRGALSAIQPGCATLLLYVVPMVALSQIPPYLIRRAASSPTSPIGLAAGSVMATSTIGSIVGTLVTSFWLVPSLGVRTTLAVFSGSGLLLLGWGCWHARDRYRPAALLSTTLAAVSLLAFAAGRSVPKLAGYAYPHRLVFVKESLYTNMVMYEETDEDGDQFLYYMTSRRGTASSFAPRSPLKGGYASMLAKYAFLTHARSNLVLGTAAGAAVAALAKALPESHIVGVDVDPAVLEIAQQYGGIRPDSRIELVEDDARVFLRRDGRRYDFILVDAYQVDQIPLHLISREFFALARARLTPGGVLFLNTNMLPLVFRTGLEPPEHLPIEHVQATLYAAGFPSVFEEGAGLLVAFASPVSYAELTERIKAYALDESHDPDTRLTLAKAYFRVNPVERPDARPFSDDWLPTPLLQKKDLGGALTVLAQATARPEWRQHASSSGLDAVTIPYIVRNWQAEREFGIAKAEQPRYCREVEAWLAQRTTFPTLELARYFRPARCDSTLSAGLPAVVRLFRRYLQGIRVPAGRNYGPLEQRRESLRLLQGVLREIS
jgi:predicted membrane-bound spermidine synthase